MFRKYFGIEENPFSNTPDPAYLFMSDRHQEALAHLQYGVQGSSGFVLLTGEVGTGKTTVCRCLVEQLPKNVDLAMCLNPRLNEAELLASICDELAVNVKKCAPGSVKDHMDALNVHLLKVHAKGRRAVLIIDEAQSLPPSLLELVRLLTNLETASTKLLQIILVGQPELRDLMDTYGMRQINQRITARYHLDPMTPAESEKYIRHRLQVGKLDPDLIEPAAVAEICARSAGIPRLINALCERSLLGAYATGATRIGDTLAATAAREVLGSKPPALTPRQGAPGLVWAFASFLAAAVVSGTLILSQRDKNAAPAFAAAAPAKPPAAAPPPAAKTPPKNTPTRARPKPRKPVVVVATSAKAESESEELKAVGRLLASGAVTPASPAAPETAAPETAAPEPNNIETAAGDGMGGTEGKTEVAAATPGAGDAAPSPIAPAAITDTRLSEKLTLENLFRRPDVKGDIGTAVTRLFALWNKDAKALSGLIPCIDAEALGLKCFRSRGPWSKIESINRPALISLVDAGGNRKYAIVSSLSGTRATLEIDGRTMTAEAGDIQPLWPGDFLVLWNPPPPLQRTLRPGMTGKDVVWLRQRLRDILGGSPGDSTGGANAKADSFDDGLKKLVIAFQEGRKLKTDGIVGTLTRIQLGAAIAPSTVPVLRTQP